ncbi:hypothetical protein [Dethiosulfatarculus sandiegensis]|uniref:hypothetical protein n=1 Tax=Dethiosulfatarculus sandiegensis TaxID=1429043 RepID=UPI0012E0E7A5|nr:hypothetical protein [Dethiosulfatarculus sandiegensis]
MKKFKERPAGRPIEQLKGGEGENKFPHNSTLLSSTGKNTLKYLDFFGSVRGAFFVKFSKLNKSN